MLEELYKSAFLFYLFPLLFGFLLVFLRARGRRDAREWIILYLVGFGCLWRLFYPRGMLTTRYWLSLLFPVTWGFGIFATFWLERDLRLFRWRISGRWIFAAIMLTLTSYTAVMVVRIQPKHLEECARVIREDSGGDSALILCTKDWPRIGYYSGLEAKPLALSGKLSPGELTEALKREFRRFRYCADRIYAVLVLPSGAMISALREDPELRVVAEMDYRRRVSLRLVVVALRPGPERSYRQLPVSNGDFSKALSGKAAQAARDAMIGRGAEFFKDVRILLPESWSVYSRDARARIFLEDDAAGRHVRLSAVGVASLQYAGESIPGPAGAGIRFSARGTPGTIMEVRVWEVDGKMPQKPHATVAVIRVTPEWKAYTVPFDGSGLAEGARFSFELVVRGGDAAVDDVLLLREVMDGKTTERK